MCIQFRWIVPEGTNTQPRILQVRHLLMLSETDLRSATPFQEIAKMWSPWQSVPTVVIPMDEFRAARDGH